MAEEPEGFVGIDLGGTNLKAGLVDPEGKIVRRAYAPTGASGGKEEVISRIVELAEKLSPGKSSPVGVASPGPVDALTGFLLNPPNLPGWGRVDLREELEKRLTRKVYVENDANMVAYGEWRFGVGRGAESLLCITLGTGVGSGLILDGHLHKGAHGFAGELGHTVVDPDGPLCRCGSRGCLESLVGARGIVTEAERMIQAGKSTALQESGDELTVEEISRAARDGDAVAGEVLRRAGYYLGIAVSNTLALLDVELVILGGGIARAEELILDPVRSVVSSTLIDYDLRSLDILNSELGNDAGILGICAYSRAST